MKIKPILDKIIIKPQEPAEETSGGIIIANAKNEGIIEAVVVAVGPGAYDDKGKFQEVRVAVGNRILVNNSAGEKFEFDKENYATIKENEIVAVVS